MASKMQPVRLLFLFLLGVLLSISADARPCKSLFVTFSLHRHRALNYRDPFSEMAIIVDVTEFKSSGSSVEAIFPSVGEDVFQFNLRRPSTVATRPHSVQELPLGLSYDFSSLRDRTKGILAIFVALLFGVGCGALTAATMYLAYSLFASRFSHRSSIYDDYADEDDYSDDNKENIKNMGYIKIPDDAAPVKAVA